MSLHLSVPDAKPETITEKQVRLWQRHEKATTDQQRKEIEREIEALEKQKPKGTLEPDRMKR